MSIADLLAALRAADVRLFVKNGQLHFDAPKGALTALVRAELAAHKADVIRRLTAPPPMFAPEHFANWIPVIGADGRLGWQAPGLPVEDRWWQRKTFDQLLSWPLSWPRNVGGPREGLSKESESPKKTQTELLS